MVRKIPSLVPDNFFEVCQKLYQDGRIKDLISMASSNRDMNDMCQPFINKYFSKKVCVSLVEYYNDIGDTVKHLVSINYRCTVKTMYQVISRIFDKVIKIFRDSTDGEEEEEEEEEEELDELNQTKERALKLIKEAIEMGNYLLKDVNFGLNAKFHGAYSYRAFDQGHIIMSNSLIMGYLLMVTPIERDSVGEYAEIKYFEY